MTAALIGLRSRLDSFKLQRFVNEYPEEALAAILPGVALQQLWGLVGVAETALGAVAAMVVVTALLGMATMVLATLNERRREMAILRSVGATPAHIMGLLLAEAALLVTAGAALGMAVTYGALAVLRPLIDKRYGLYLEIGPPDAGDLAALAAILAGWRGGRPAAGVARLPPVAGRRDDRTDVSMKSLMIFLGRRAGLVLAPGRRARRWAGRGRRPLDGHRPPRGPTSPGSSSCRRPPRPAASAAP